jgi:hypothetical protein
MNGNPDSNLGSPCISEAIITIFTPAVTYLKPWHRFLLEKLMVTQLVKNLQNLMEFEDSLSRRNIF